MTRNPKLDLPMVVAFTLATIASFFLAGYRLAELAYDRLHKESR